MMLTRRTLAIAALSAGCRSVTPQMPSRSAFIDALPMEVANDVPVDRSALEGKVVLVTFVATWCFPCVAELGALKQLRERFGAAGFVSLLVGMDLEGAAVLRPFAQAYALQEPLIVADDRLRSGTTIFGRIRELPSRVLFRRDGTIALAFSGVVPSERFEAVVRPLLNSDG